MRLLSNFEKQICRLLLKSDGQMIGDIIKPYFKEDFIFLKKDPPEVQVGFLNDENGHYSIDYNDVGRIQKTLITISNLISTLEKEGYLLLYDTGEFDKFSLGKILKGASVAIVELVDEQKSMLIVDLIIKNIILTEEFRDFCNKGFMSRAQRNVRNTLFLSGAAVIISIAVPVLTYLFTKEKDDTALLKQVTLINNGIQNIASDIDTLNKNVLRVSDTYSNSVNVTRKNKPSGRLKSRPKKKTNTKSL